VFNPAAWTGVVLAVVGVALIAGGGRLGGGRQRRSDADDTPIAASRPRRQVAATATEPADDDIEAILRKHGIS
jgi:drug/metabolite transporter (DMT)-like permease